MDLLLGAALGSDPLGKVGPAWPGTTLDRRIYVPTTEYYA